MIDFTNSIKDSPSIILEHHKHLHLPISLSNTIFAYLLINIRESKIIVICNNSNNRDKTSLGSIGIRANILTDTSVNR